MFMLFDKISAKVQQNNINMLVDHNFCTFFRYFIGVVSPLCIILPFCQWWGMVTIKKL